MVIVCQSYYSSNVQNLAGGPLLALRQPQPHKRKCHLQLQLSCNLIDLAVVLVFHSYISQAFTSLVQNKDKFSQC